MTSHSLKQISPITGGRKTPNWSINMPEEKKNIKAIILMGGPDKGMKNQ